MKTSYSFIISQDPKKPNKQGTVAEVFEYRLVIERDEHSGVCSATIEPTELQQWLPNESQFTAVATSDDDIIRDVVLRLSECYPEPEFLYSCNPITMERSDANRTHRR